jgi:hypothetical protein
VQSRTDRHGSSSYTNPKRSCAGRLPDGEISGSCVRRHIVITFSGATPRVNDAATARYLADVESESLQGQTAWRSAVLWYREFESNSLRQTVCHVSIHFGEATNYARGARFTHGPGRGECQRLRRSANSAQDSLFTILACPSANRPTSCGNPIRALEERRTQATPPRETIGCRELAPARSRAGAVRFFGSSRGR